MPRPKGRTLKELLAAAKGSKGNISHIARMLNLSRGMVTKYREKYPEFDAWIKDEEEGCLDRIEHGERGIFKKAEEGDTLSQIFVLKCKGKRRGWIEKTKVEVEGDLDVKVQWQGCAGESSHGPV